MLELSNKNKADILTMPIVDVVTYLKNIADDFEFRMCFFDEKLTDIDIKNKIEESGDEYLKSCLNNYFALRAAIYHLTYFFNRPTSFI